jgi:predicted secreted protein
MSNSDHAPLIVTQANDKTIVQAKSGAIVVVKLPAQLGTGYSWQLADSAVLKPVSQSQSPATSETPVVGGGDLQLFWFVPTKKGTYHLKFRYVQPWIKDQASAKTFAVTIWVK